MRIALSALVAGILAYPATASALPQVAGAQATISGTVTDAATGQPVAGVLVRVAGTAASAVTDANGRYSVQAPADGVLSFGHIGYRAAEVAIAGRTTVDVGLQVSAAQLQELVVTGYSTQRRADITSAVSSVNLESAGRETSSSVLQRLHGNVAGVTVDASGSPGARSTVRIRGVSSFQNNDPLYIVDGTPVEETFANWLNPHDIESVQVLKDASAASIYGARANNGVVIIETKKGRPGAPQVSLQAKFGVATPVRGYDDFLILDALDYYEVLRLSHVNAGIEVPTHIFGDPNNPTIPQYTYADPDLTIAVDQWGRPIDVNEAMYSWPNNLIMPGSPGTNWWDAVFGTGAARDVNLGVMGGGTTERYSVGFNYFDQEGTAAFNRYQRATARVNTEFDIGRLTIGENLSLARDEHFGGIPFDPGGFAEGGIVGKNVLMQPVVPLRDVAGNYASGKAPGLGNHTNPLKQAEAQKDNIFKNTRIFGNAFARYALTDNFSVNTHFGFNVGEGTSTGFNPIYPENSEPTLVNNIFETSSNFTDWTWSNTVNFQESFAGRHNTNILVGQATAKSTNRFVFASMANLVTTDINSRYIQDAIGDPATKNVNSSGGFSTLLSFFGKADYNYDERYYLSATLRRDGSSRLGPANRWGTFPAFSAGWRLSQEPFLATNDFFTNIMLRFGWGITGNQNIASGRTVDFFGGTTGTTFYDIEGTGTSIVQGYRQTDLGNPNLKWEENQSTNVGLDVEFLEGRASLVLDVYQRDTDNLLFNPPLPATAGQAAAPIVNIGEMRNRGIDLALGYRGTIGQDIGWNVDFNGAHYRNEIVRIDGEREFFFGPITTRFATQGTTINMVGHPIGSFYGLIQDGFFQTQAEIDALNAQARQLTGDPTATYQDGAAPGRFRFRDVDGDGQVTADDRTVIGDPHPDFTAGLNLGLDWRSWDFGASLFGTFGNDIFDVQKEFYVFRLFNSNVRRDLLTDSWTPENPNAKYPRLDVNDAFSNAISSFYVEDGSYVRLRSLQLGYSVPPAWTTGFGDVRVYLQGENLFTITGYSGLDPALPAANISASGMDIRDQARGIDRGIYPSNRTISLGFNVIF
ncbi:MAG: SusC/RagA family TonB-linked outer membrane protein [Longimicrobiales bacterium]